MSDHGKNTGGRRNRSRRGPSSGGARTPASVGARFHDVEGVRVFLEKLGMPDSLVGQLTDWMRELPPGEAERMEPELAWEGRQAVLSITAVVDEEDGGVDVEFGGPASLIEALQADLDEFFRPKQPGRKK